LTRSATIVCAHVLWGLASTSMSCARLVANATSALVAAMAAIIADMWCRGVGRGLGGRGGGVGGCLCWSICGPRCWSPSRRGCRSRRGHPSRSDSGAASWRSCRGGCECTGVRALSRASCGAHVLWCFTPTLMASRTDFVADATWSCVAAVAAIIACVRCGGVGG